VIKLEMTEVFEEWILDLAKRDLRCHAKVLVRLDRASDGNFGDCAPVGHGVSEMRIDYGPGLRIYFTRLGSVVYLLLLGGDKGTQSKDIKEAHQIAGALVAGRAGGKVRQAKS
jgi:putative addiction module killer protein